VVEVGRGLTIAYREWGGQGRPIALLHGLASNAGIWEPVAARLAPRFRVVAFDQRGHGRSDKPNDGYDFDRVVADASEAFERLGVVRPLLVGHSWGGNVALHFAATVDPPPRGLVLVDGGFIELSRRMTWPEAEERLRPPNTDLPVEQFRQRIRDRLGDRWSAAWEEAVLGNFSVDRDGVLRRNLSIENHMRILRHLYEHRPSTLFPCVAGPIQVVVALPPAESGPSEREANVRQLLAEAEPRCDLRVEWMRDTLHDVPLDRPDELAALIADLADRTA
jgi:pimeloyl-ACP methyl ester carboxylesterase